MSFIYFCLFIYLFIYIQYLCRVIYLAKASLKIPVLTIVINKIIYKSKIFSTWN